MKNFYNVFLHSSFSPDPNLPRGVVWQLTYYDYRHLSEAVLGEMICIIFEPVTKGCTKNGTMHSKFQLKNVT